MRFRKNLGGDVKKKEIKCIAKKITGKRACGKSIDKDKENILLEYNFKTEKNGLRKSVSQEPGGKIKNYIKGVTNVEELKQDSKIHQHNSSSERGIKKIKIDSKNIVNSVNRRKQKNNTVVAGVHNLRNLKKEHTEINSDDSENSENNSLTNVVQNNNNKDCLSVEGIGSNKTNYGTNTNSNNRYLYKDVPIDCEDKIINELAEDLEQTNNKIKDNIEKNNNIQTLINKIEPMNINMNINKIENLNYNNNENIKEAKKQSKKNENSDIETISKDNNTLDTKINSIDKKLTNIEVYTKEKIIDLISQIENLRQLFVNTNKIQSFAVNPLFKFPTYNNQNPTSTNQPQKMKEAHIVEIGGKMLPPPSKVSKKYFSNNNNVITAKDKEKESTTSKDNSNRELNVVMNKAEINLPKDISQRIKTGKPPTSIKTIINRTLGANNNTIIFSNMANDFNSKFLKGVEKKTINGNIMNKNNFGENSNLNMNNINMNKYIDLNKITTNNAVKTQNNFRGDINLLVNDNITNKI